MPDAHIALRVPDGRVLVPEGGSARAENCRQDHTASRTVRVFGGDALANEYVQQNSKRAITTSGPAKPWRFQSRLEATNE